jgi:hypothetical protein
MERLKLAIADKILEVTSREDELIKQNLSRIQRFSDFAEACKSLMVKYPEIEDELLEMVLINDFDTARASRRVDSIINRSQVPVSREMSVPVNEEADDLSDRNFKNSDSSLPSEDKSEETNLKVEEESFSAESSANFISEEKVPDEDIIYSTIGEEDTPDEEMLKKQKQQKAFQIVWKSIALILALVLIYFIVKFVINYWKYILIVVVVLVAVFILWTNRKKKNK